MQPLTDLSETPPLSEDERWMEVARIAFPKQRNEQEVIAEQQRFVGAGAARVHALWPECMHVFERLYMHVLCPKYMHALDQSTQSTMSSRAHFPHVPEATAIGIGRVDESEMLAL